MTQTQAAPRLRRTMTIVADIARASRNTPDDTALLTDLRKELCEAKIREVIVREVHKAPPLSPEQRARLTALLYVPDGGDDE